MLWKKAWNETAWRFVIGLALLSCSAAATVIIFPKMAELTALVSTERLPGELARQVQEAVQASREFRGFVSLQWYGQNGIQIFCLCAALLGSCGITTQGSGGAAMFTLSLPVSRDRLLGTRVGTGLAELVVLGLVPGLLIALLAPTIGAAYSVLDVLVHGLCLFVAGSVVFSLAVYLSTQFSDPWRPPLLALVGAILIGVLEQILGHGHGLFHAMSGGSWTRTGELPWASLLASVVVSSGLLWASARNFARRDF